MQICAGEGGQVGWGWGGWEWGWVGGIAEQTGIHFTPVIDQLLSVYISFQDDTSTGGNGDMRPTRFQFISLTRVLANMHTAPVPG